jgi:hypothetical protein
MPINKGRLQKTQLCYLLEIKLYFGFFLCGFSGKLPLVFISFMQSVI